MLGLPSKFTSFRSRDQEQAVEALGSSRSRFIGLAAPIGFGKTVAYMAHALSNDLRTLVLTGTKQQQDQIGGEFKDVGMADLRGRNNYRCPLHGNCEKGMDSGCREPARGSCSYGRAVVKASKARLVVGNYFHRLASATYGRKDSIGEFDLVVLDEAHELDGILTAANTLKLPAVRGYPEEGDREPWPAVLSSWSKGVENRIRQLGGTESVASKRERTNLQNELAVARNLGLTNGRVPEEVAIDLAASGNEYLFRSINPGRSAELLYGSARQVVCVSATLRPKLMESLFGVGAGYELLEYSSDFPADRWRIYVLPVCRVEHRMPVGNKLLWLSRIERVLSMRGDRKGVIQTVSFDRARGIVNNSKYQKRMLYHKPGGSAAAVNKFRDAAPPAVLVSPSVSTGVDLPYGACEYIIIAKVPFPDMRGSKDFYARRKKSDPGFYYYQTIQKLVQSAGRAMRAPDDRCEVFILDDHALWLLNPKGEHARHIPTWWPKFYTVRELEVPAPPDKL